MKSSVNTVVDIEASKAALERMGFESAVVNGDCMAKRIQGTFGFQVVVYLVDDAFDRNPLARAHFDVVLPHQCDSWQILGSESEVGAAHEIMRSFTKQSRQATDWLIRATGAVIYKEAGR